ncbi:Sec23-binding domain of Sec16-domain-containing protein [Zopfochytrium polystomum]|nr:Sec23-binding domain of Sec16-domain-containing protein [Zopfochytrium polystomum]
MFESAVPSQSFPLPGNIAAMSEPPQPVQESHYAEQFPTAPVEVQGTDADFFSSWGVPGGAINLEEATTSDPSPFEEKKDETALSEHRSFNQTASGAAGHSSWTSTYIESSEEQRSFSQSAPQAVGHSSWSSTYLENDVGVEKAADPENSYDSEPVKHPAEPVFAEPPAIGPDAVYPQGDRVYAQGDAMYPQGDAVYPQEDGAYPQREEVAVFQQGESVYGQREAVHFQGDATYLQGDAVYSQEDAFPTQDLYGEQTGTADGRFQQWEYQDQHNYNEGVLTQEQTNGVDHGTDHQSARVTTLSEGIPFEGAPYNGATNNVYDNSDYSMEPVAQHPSDPYANGLHEHNVDPAEVIYPQQVSDFESDAFSHGHYQSVDSNGLVHRVELLRTEALASASSPTNRPPAQFGPNDAVSHENFKTASSERPVCATCGRANQPGSSFCGGCGMRLAKVLSPATGTSTNPGFAPNQQPQHQLVAPTETKFEPSNVPLAQMPPPAPPMATPPPSAISTAPYQSRSQRRSRPGITRTPSNDPSLVYDGSFPRESPSTIPSPTPFNVYGQPQLHQDPQWQTHAHESAQPGGFVDPLGRHRGHSIASWGFGGKLVVTKPRIVQRMGAVGMGKWTAPGPIHIYPVQSVLFEGEALSGQVPKFPGPLIGGKSKLKKKDIVKLAEDGVKQAETDLVGIKSRIAAESQWRGGVAVVGASEDIANAEDWLILWKLVKLMVEQDGAIIGPKSEQSHSALLEIFRPASPEPTSTLAMVENAIIVGNRRSAIDIAVSVGQFALALAIAAQTDKEVFAEVTLQYARETFGLPLDQRERVASVNEPNPVIQVMISMFGGRGPASAADFLAASDQNGELSTPLISRWRDVAMAILANRCPGDTPTLVALGDQLRQRGRVAAAHVCYVLVNKSIPLNGPDGSNTRVVLLGVDHLRKPTTFSRNFHALHLTEIFEYSQTLMNNLGTAGCLPHLQAYKLTYAWWLADHGFGDISTRYCDAVEQILKTYSKGAVYFHQTFFNALRELVDRNANAQNKAGASAVSDGKDTGSWLSRMAKLDTLVTGLNRLMNASVGEAPPPPSSKPPSRNASYPGVTLQGTDDVASSSSPRVMWPSSSPFPAMFSTSETPPPVARSGSGPLSALSLPTPPPVLRTGSVPFSAPDYNQNPQELNIDQHAWTGFDPAFGGNPDSSVAYNDGQQHFQAEYSEQWNTQSGDHSYSQLDGQGEQSQQEWGNDAVQPPSHWNGEANPPQEWNGQSQQWSGGWVDETQFDGSAMAQAPGYDYTNPGHAANPIHSQNDYSQPNQPDFDQYNASEQAFNESQQSYGNGPFENATVQYESVNPDTTTTQLVEPAVIGAPLPTPPPVQSGVAKPNPQPDDFDDLGLSNTSLRPNKGLISSTEPIKTDDNIGSNAAEPQPSAAAAGSSASSAASSNRSSGIFSFIPSFGWGAKKEDKPAVKVADLGEGNQLVFDPVQKRWVSKKTGTPVSTAKEVPPPPMASSWSAPASRNTTPAPPPFLKPAGGNDGNPPARASSANPQMDGLPPISDGSGRLGSSGSVSSITSNRGVRRGARNKYVDIMNPDSGKSSGSSTPSASAMSFLPVAGVQFTDGTSASASRPNVFMPSPATSSSSVMDELLGSSEAVAAQEHPAFKGSAPNNPPPQFHQQQLAQQRQSQTNRWDSQGADGGAPRQELSRPPVAGRTASGGTLVGGGNGAGGALPPRPGPRPSSNRMATAVAHGGGGSAPMDI